MSLLLWELKKYSYGPSSTLEYTFTKLLEVSLERTSTSELEDSKCKCCWNQDIKLCEVRSTFKKYLLLSVVN